MYGAYDIPVELKKKDLSLSVTTAAYGYEYTRRISDRPDFNKLILADRSRMLINPVEPLNNPKHVTDYFQLEFDKKMTIAPHKEKKFFATFPIEIGVFLFTKQDFEPFDIINLVPAKYSLYGDPRVGVLTRYHKTGIFSEEPDIDPLRYGVVSISVRNTDSQWNTISRLVINAYGMRLYYNEKIVKLFSTMKVLNEISAETDCYSPPSDKGFKKAMELYKSRKISITSSKFVMMEGI